MDGATKRKRLRDRGRFVVGCFGFHGESSFSAQASRMTIHHSGLGRTQVKSETIYWWERLSGRGAIDNWGLFLNDWDEKAGLMSGMR
jgi:hypothetical protein